MIPFLNSYLFGNVGLFIYHAVASTWADPSMTKTG
jgi:hypothetical protein